MVELIFDEFTFVQISWRGGVKTEDVDEDTRT